MKQLLALAFAAALSLSLAPGSASAADDAQGGLDITHPVAFETPAMARTGAGFLTITNTGPADDTLLEVRADFPKVEVHTTEETDGVARMVHVETLPIPAGQTVTLAPGGLHVMFMGLDAPFEAGDQIPATLVFQSAGEVPVTFTVEPRPAPGKAMDHSGH